MTLITAVLGLFFIFLFVTVSTNAAISHLRRAQESADRIAAYYLAEAGAQLGLVELVRNDYDPHAISQFSRIEENGTFDVSVGRQDADLKFTSTGVVNGSSETIEVVVSTAGVGGGIFAGENISFLNHGHGQSVEFYTDLYSRGDVRLSGHFDFGPGYSYYEDVSTPVPRILTAESLEDYYLDLVSSGLIVEENRWNWGNILTVTENTHFLRGLRSEGDVIVPEGVVAIVEGFLEVRGTLVVDGIVYVKASVDSHGDITGQKQSHENGYATITGTGLIAADGDIKILMIEPSPPVFALQYSPDDDHNETAAIVQGDNDIFLYSDGDLDIELMGGRESVLRADLIAQGSISGSTSGHRLTMIIESAGTDLSGYPFELYQPEPRIISWKRSEL